MMGYCDFWEISTSGRELFGVMNYQEWWLVTQECLLQWLIYCWELFIIYTYVYIIIIIIIYYYYYYYDIEDYNPIMGI